MRPGALRAGLAAVATVAAMAGCSGPPAASIPSRGDVPITVPAPSTIDKQLPPEAASRGQSPAPWPGSPPPPVGDAPIPEARPDKPARIETVGGVAVVAVVPVQCPAGGGQPFARWLATADVVDPRLAAAGVDSRGRAEVARLTVAWTRGERLLLVYGGAMPNPGHRLAVDSIARTPGGALQVRGHRVAPPPGTLQPQVLAHPCQVIQLADPDAARQGAIEFSLAR